MIRELWARRELILSLVRRDLKTRYKASVLGFIWSFCKPLLLMLVLYVVFQYLVRFTFPMKTPFALFLLSGILAWTYLTGSLNESMFSIIGNTSLVRKTYIPPQVFPVVTILSNLFHFLLALLVYFGLLAIFTLYHAREETGGTFITWHIVFLPLVIALQTFFIFGMALLLSAVNVFYRDVASIMEVFITGWFYFSPIFYPLSEPERQIMNANLPDWLFQLYMLNPMAPILGAYREVMLLPAFGDAEFSTRLLLIYLLLALINSLIIFVAGQAVFKHYTGRFADEV